MDCPYCKEFIEEDVYDIGDYYNSGYGVDTYYDEFHCTCPHCDKMFKWFENYVRVGDDCTKMEDN